MIFGQVIVDFSIMAPKPVIFHEAALRHGWSKELCLQCFMQMS